MTEYSEVGVGDTVTLRSKRHPTATLTGEVREIHPDQLYIVAHGWVSEIHWEIIEHQPKPVVLPTTPGLYYVPEAIGLWRFDGFVWKTDLSGSWVELGGTSYVPRNLVRLVSVSAVEEARAEVVKEIVAEIVTWLRDESYSSLASRIKNKFIGGKA